jgi:tetratricopeptide (TPR) repeat protein
MLSFLLFAAAAQSPYSPEVEALMRRRDERRAQEARGRLAETSQETTLASVVPVDVAPRLAACLGAADEKPESGLAEASKWAGEGGGPFAAQCRGYALGKASRFTEAAGAFETGANMSGIDDITRARLWSQAGNAALAAGDVRRAVAALDHALEKKLPATLATGEIRLDRARARVAANDLKGARGDLDEALKLAAADPLAWLLSATLARREEDLPLARAHIEQAARLSRNDPHIALEQGVIYALSADRDPAARAAFERAEQVAGKDSDIAKKAQAYIAQLTPTPAASTPSTPTPSTPGSATPAQPPLIPAAPTPPVPAPTAPAGR